MAYEFSPIQEEILKQSRPGNFSCKTCIFYKGSCICEKGVFIAFEGATIEYCSFYIAGRKCRHCGQIT